MYIDMLSAEIIKIIKDLREQQAQVDIRDRKAFLLNMVFVWSVIKASERLLIEAAAESSGKLKDYYVSHLEEERNHEKWLAEDLKTAGIDVSSIAPIRLAVELAGSQYYLIKHHNPASLLGYMAVLEGLPYSIADVELLEKLHGKDLVRTLRYHAVNDVEHAKDLFNVIDEINSPEIVS